MTQNNSQDRKKYLDELLSEFQKLSCIDDFNIVLNNKNFLAFSYSFFDSVDCLIRKQVRIYDKISPNKLYYEVLDNAKISDAVKLGKMAIQKLRIMDINNI